jgi:flagellar biosynthesis protein FlhF
MRLRTFNAPSMSAAIREVRAALGEDAIIVATQRGRNGTGVRVTAAIDREGADGNLGDLLAREDDGAIEPVLGSSLAFHGTPLPLAGRLIDAALGAGGTPVAALARALGRVFRFQPLPDPTLSFRIALVGPPGMGKTVSAAKIAARSALARAAIHVVSTDRFRAGGVDQLAALTEVMTIRLHVAATPDELRRLIAGFPPSEPVLVDTAGVNPFHIAAIGQLVELVDAAGAEPVLTLAAGGDVDEAADIAGAFAAIGSGRLLVTRIDAARRLGGILAAADACGLAFAGAGLSPHIAGGLESVTPEGLADRLIRTRQARDENGGAP